MKAIIMAGGEGKRPKPVSVDTAKPLVPLCGRAVIEHLILLLKEQHPDLEMEQENDLIRISTPIEDSSVINGELVKSGVKVYELKNENIGFEDFFIERLGK